MQENTLTVRISSFSYKRGIPADPSGNGGGFVFDCRAIHNPGKYEQYKRLTGKQQPIIEFLDKESEMQDFLNDVYSLVSRSVEKYLERGFTSLTVSFGCTGGQHRSVYSAEHLAQYLCRFPVRIELQHVEQEINPAN